MTLLRCAGCDGLGYIVFPEIETLDGKTIEEKEHLCLDCEGTGILEYVKDSNACVDSQRSRKAG